MSILQDVYHITAPTSANFYVQEDPWIDYIASNKLVDVVQKNFFFDIDILSELDNVDADIFWNFGDPFCPIDENEIVVNTIVQSTVSHVYTQAGSYTVHSIVTINGVLFHIEKRFTIAADNHIVHYFEPVIISAVGYTDENNILNTTIIGEHCDEFIITDTNVEPDINDINWSVTPPTEYQL